MSTETECNCGKTKSCKPCRNRYMREYYRADPRRSRRAALSRGKSRGYHISLEQYEEMEKQQNGVCMICGRPEHMKHQGKVRNLSVDHCHTTGKIRGLLCNNCNRGIGHLGDDPALLRAAADYLERF
jgi:hypothetical protein